MRYETRGVPGIFMWIAWSCYFAIIASTVGIGLCPTSNIRTKQSQYNNNDQHHNRLFFHWEVPTYG